ncbi:calreticulin and calnexin [Anaeramoeba flamelloides]|uniref:Calreticulin and calnexin n=1 Tax=Anaeramoeba flamelloides TaxID=1746091 RepID=A0ABQ8Y0Q0_9EUKA|nr:calreticulin and calnexin [Anaeramoeba flamelloides]
MNKITTLFCQFLLLILLTRKIVSGSSLHSNTYEQLHFLETFENSTTTNLPLHEWEPTKQKNYHGSFVRKASNITDEHGDDYVLVAEKAGYYYGYSHVFETPFSPINDDHGLVLQYSTTFSEFITCGGGYIKLFYKFKPKKLGQKTNYAIMFGPDICGGNNNIHFIYTRKNPNNKNLEERKLKNPPQAPMDHLSHLYTLVLDRANRFQMYLDMELIREGNLLDDFEGVHHPSMDDPNDKPPEDWVDDYWIRDPSDLPPEDWTDEEYVIDVDAFTPQEWDVVQDGEWEPPLIANEKWKKKWVQRKILNPEWRGEWEPRKIYDKLYWDDRTPYKLDTIYGIGFEIWSVNKNVFFDDIILSTNDHKSLIWDYAEKIWKPKYNTQLKNQSLLEN